MNAIMIIDGNYLYQAVKNAFGIKRPKFPDCAYNFIRHYEKAENIKVHLIRVRYHDSPPCDGGSEQFTKKKNRFLDKLREMPKFDVVLGRCQTKNREGYGQKGVDVNMAIDIVNYASNIDALFVISGDSDLIPAFDIARKRGAEVVLFVSPHHKRIRDGSIDLLIKAADVNYEMGEELVTKNAQLSDLQRKR